MYNTVSEIFSFKEWRDLEIGGRGRSRSLKLAPFDRPYTTFYWYDIVNIAPPCTVFIARKHTDARVSVIHIAILSVRPSVRDVPGIR